MERKILLIDDNFQRMMELEASLQPKIIIQHAFNIKDATKILSESWFSVVVINIAKEREASFAFLSLLRKARPMPIVVTGTTGDKERANTYRLGADQCVDTPVDVEEVREAINASLRRYYELNIAARLREPDMALSYKELWLDPQRWEVTMHGQPVHLLAKEFGVLYFLMCNPKIVFTKEQIYQHIYEDVESEVDNRVYGLVKNLRKKIEENPEEPHYIETIRGVGYRFRA